MACCLGNRGFSVRAFEDLYEKVHCQLHFLINTYSNKENTLFTPE